MSRASLDNETLLRQKKALNLRDKAAVARHNKQVKALQVRVRKSKIRIEACNEAFKNFDREAEQLGILDE